MWILIVILVFGIVFDCNVDFSGSVRTSFYTPRHNTEQLTYEMIDIQCEQQTVLQTPARTYSRDRLMVLRLPTLTADLRVRRSVDDLGVRHHRRHRGWRAGRKTQRPIGVISRDVNTDRRRPESADDRRGRRLLFRCSDSNNLTNRKC